MQQTPIFQQHLIILHLQSKITLLFRCIALILAPLNKNLSIEKHPHPLFFSTHRAGIPLTTIVPKKSPLSFDWLRAENILTSFVQKIVDTHRAKPPLTGFVEKKFRQNFKGFVENPHTPTPPPVYINPP